MAELVESYRSAFERGDVDGVVDRLGEGVCLVADTGTGVRSDVVAGAGRRVLVSELIAHYRTLGVSRIEARAVETISVSHRLALASVTWVLLDDGGRTIYEFHAVYTVNRVEAPYRIVAIAHDERARARAVQHNP